MVANCNVWRVSLLTWLFSFAASRPSHDGPECSHWNSHFMVSPRSHLIIVHVSPQVLPSVVIFQWSNSTKASCLRQPCPGKEPFDPSASSVAEPVGLLLLLELFFFWEIEIERERNEGASKPLWNNACKHRQCITQVMRFSTLLISKAPQHQGRTNNPLPNTSL